MGSFPEIDEIRALNEKFEIEDSLQRIAELPEDDSELFYFGRVWKIMNYLHMGKIEEAEKITNNMVELIDPDTEEKLSITLKIAIIAIRLFVLRYAGEFEDMRNLIKSGNSLIQSRLDIANFFEENQEEIDKKNDLIFWISRFKWHSAIHFSNFGDSDKFIELFKDNIKLQYLIDDKFGIIASLLSLAYSYSGLGEVDLALKYYIDASKVLKHVDNTRLATHLNLNISVVYMMKGEVDLAQKCALEACEIADKLEDIKLLSEATKRLGEVYHQMGKYQMAKDCFETALNDAIDSPESIPEIVTYLVSSYVELNNQERTDYYFKKLEQLARETENNRIDQLYRLGLAIILKQKKRMRSRVKAHDLFLEIIDEGSLSSSYDFIIIASLNLSELLIDELAVYQDEEILNEVVGVINKLNESVQKQHLFPTMVDVMILQSRLSLIQGDFSKAQKILNQADLLSQEKNLRIWSDRVQEQIKLLGKERNQWKQLTEDPSSLRDRLKVANLREYIIKCKQTGKTGDS